VSSLLVKAAIIAGVVYLAVVAGLFLVQRQVLFPAPQHAVAPPAGFSEVRYGSDDGLELKAAYRPAAAGKPTVVFFHGNGDNWTGAAAATAAWAAAGFGVLLPEYRGYSGNPGSPSKEGLLADGRAAMQWLAAQGVAGEQLIIVGNSIGSGIAVPMAAARRPRALVLVSPFASLPDLAAEKFPWLPARWLVRDRFDNCSALKPVAAPVLIQHGRADSLIPYSHAERLARCLPAAKLEGFSGVGHDLAYRPAAQQAALDWLSSP
jgi:pimeloyl-ACP methyl ester carboxylesterase